MENQLPPFRGAFGRPYKILIAEDDQAIRSLISLSLEAEGYELLEAADGEEAVRMAKAHKPDLILLDVMMPGMDGYDVIRALRRDELKKDMRFVLLTAKREETDYVMGWNLGIDEYMTKPFDPGDLASVVRTTLTLTREELQSKRLAELHKANLLSRIETAFGQGVD